MPIIIAATSNNMPQTLLEIDGPHEGDTSKYGDVWKLYKYRIVEPGQTAISGEIHAVPDEGLVRLIERISIRARK